MLACFLEEFDEGFRADLGSYHFTREEALWFASRYDPQPFHLDDEAASRSYFGKLAVSGWHTAAGWMSCYVASNNAARAALAAQGKPLPEIGPSPGFDDMRWLKPVYPGDTLRYSSRVTARRPLASRPQWGLLTTYNDGVNQHGELVFSFIGKVLTARR